LELNCFLRPAIKRGKVRQELSFFLNNNILLCKASRTIMQDQERQLDTGTYQVGLCDGVWFRSPLEFNFERCCLTSSQRAYHRPPFALTSALLEAFGGSAVYMHSIA
jgi:hypothetical protein